MKVQPHTFLIKWGSSVNKWSDVKYSDVRWTDVIYVKWFHFKVKWSEWSEVSYGEVLVDKGAMYIMVNLYCGHLIILWLFHLGISCTVCFNLYCGGFILFCNVCVCVRACVCACARVCVRACVCVRVCGGVGCFGNMYTVLWLRFFLTWQVLLTLTEVFRAFSLFVRQMPG